MGELVQLTKLDGIAVIGRMVCEGIEGAESHLVIPEEERESAAFEHCGIRERIALAAQGIEHGLSGFILVLSQVRPGKTVPGGAVVRASGVAV